MLFLTKNEKIFIGNNKLNIEGILCEKKKTALFIAHPDQFFLLYWKVLIKKIFKKKIYNVIGIWSLSVAVPQKKKIQLIEVIIDKIKSIYHFFLKKKWTLLYKVAGIQKIFHVNDLPIKLNKKKIDLQVNQILSNIKNKEDILKIKLNNILVGDLIYDSYIRYRSKPTVDIEDTFFLKKLLFKSISNLALYNYLYKKFDIESLFTVYCVYLNFGLAVRFFLSKNVSVYSWSTFAHNLKKIDSKFPYDENVLGFKKKFLNLKNKKKKIKFARDELNKKFKNKLDISLQFAQPILNINKKSLEYLKNINIYGVVFLHCFNDSAHYYGTKTIFCDHYDWAVFTLDLIKKNNLKIGVKTHPYALPESKKIFAKLKLKYKSLVWLPEYVANIDIIKNPNINFFISNQGSILYEAAYFGKTSISSGVNRTSSYNFSYNPKNVSEYKKLLLNLKKINIKKKNKLEICQIYYLSFMDNKNILNTIVEKIQLEKFNFKQFPKYYRNLNYFDNKINTILR